MTGYEMMLVSTIQTNISVISGYVVLHWFSQDYIWRSRGLAEQLTCTLHSCTCPQFVHCSLLALFPGYLYMQIAWEPFGQAGKPGCPLALSPGLPRSGFELKSETVIKPPGKKLVSGFQQKVWVGAEASYVNLLTQ